MKAIGFLGKSSYEQTTYEYQGQRESTRFFSAALPYFFPQLDKVLVFVTPEVKEHDNYATLKQLLGEKFQDVEIPNGTSEEEMWKIFDALIESVPAGEEVIFDITHSFRSLPLLTFLAASYLRVVRGVKVKKILYGAFQAKDAQTGITPVLDLSPFIDLLDWLTAAQQFLQTGNAEGLAAFLIEKGKAEKIGSMRNAGESLLMLSQQLMLMRPLKVMETAAKLHNRLQKADVASIKPFELLLEHVQEEYASRALIEPNKNPLDSLRIQLGLIQWYAEKNHYMQAVTLAREWLISAFEWKIDNSLEFNPERREEIQKGLTGISKEISKQKVELNEFGKKIKEQYADITSLGKLMDAVTQIRNDIDHAGMNKSAQDAKELIKRINEEIIVGIQAVAKNLKIVE